MDILPTDIATKIDNFRKRWFIDRCLYIEQSIGNPILHYAKEQLNDINYSIFINLYIRIFDNMKEPQLFIFDGANNISKWSLLTLLIRHIKWVKFIYRIHGVDILHTKLLYADNPHNGLWQLINAYLSPDKYLSSGEFITVKSFTDSHTISFIDRHADIIVITNSLYEKLPTDNKFEHNTFHIWFD